MFKRAANKSFWLLAILIAFSACNRHNPSQRMHLHLCKERYSAGTTHCAEDFSLQKYESFELQIPPHCLRPRLHGNFKSFRYGEKGNRASDEAASVDLLLLDEQQFNDFVNGPGEATTHSAQNTYEQQIDWALPSSFENPRNITTWSLITRRVNPKQKLWKQI